MFENILGSQNDNRLERAKAGFEKAKLADNAKAALKHLDVFVELSPQVSFGWINRAIALARLGRLDESIASFKECLKIEPYNARIWTLLGLNLIDAGRTEESLSAFKTALKFDPNNDIALKNRAQSAAELGQYQDAVETLEKALTLSKNDAELWQFLAECRFRQNEYGKCADALDQGLKVDSDLSGLRYLYGVIFYERRNFQAAVEQFKRCLVQDTTNLSAMCFLYLSQCELGDLEARLLICERALKLTPKDGRWWQYRGETLSLLRRFPESEFAFKRSLKFSPEKNDQAWHGLAMIHFHWYTREMRLNQKKAWVHWEKCLRFANRVSVKEWSWLESAIRHVLQIDGVEVAWRLLEDSGHGRSSFSPIRQIVRHLQGDNDDLSELPAKMRAQVDQLMVELKNSKKGLPSKLK